MRRVLKGAAFAAGGLAVLLAVASTTAFTVSSRKLSQKYDVRLTTVSVPADAASVQWGSHLVNNVSSCRECHGPDLAGTIMGDDPVARMVAPNLTRGKGGIGATMTDADWVRAIRHGVKSDGRTLIVMPSYAYAHFSDHDLGAVIAYLKQLPPVDNELPAFRLKALGRALVAAGVFDNELVAKKVPVRDSYDAVEPGVTLEYGTYLANVSGCTSCHGPDLKGLPSGAPGAPPAADISRTGIGSWERDDFFRAIRQGRRPDGSEISEYMPWRYLSEMTDAELDAVWVFLQTR